MLENLLAFIMLFLTPAGVVSVVYLVSQLDRRTLDREKQGSKVHTRHTKIMWCRDRLL